MFNFSPKTQISSHPNQQRTSPSRDALTNILTSPTSSQQPPPTAQMKRSAAAAAAAAFLTPIATPAPSVRPAPRHSRRPLGRRRAITAVETPPRATPPPPPAPTPTPARVGATPARPARTASVSRKTGETFVQVALNLDGTGKCDVESGIPFLDHMLAQLCSHGLIDLTLRAEGDLWIDDHHTNEDVGITLGMAIAKALGAKAGIERFGHFVAPLDEALVEVVMDFSGRPHLQYALDVPTQRVGTYDTQLVREFYSAVAANAQMTLHVTQRAGVNSHHIIEASFKAFARAMRMAMAYDARRLGSIPSSKGVLTDDQAVEA